MLIPTLDSQVVGEVSLEHKRNPLLGKPKNDSEVFRVFF